MRSMKTAGDGDLMTFGNFAFAKLLGTRSSFQHKKLSKPRNIQGQEFLVANQFAAYREADFPGSESGVLDRLGNSWPWKYGFKSIKSIVRFEFVRNRPPTFWNQAGPNEYGFVANVNPAVPHPRWSQASEQVVETGERIPTLPFNGYQDYVASSIVTFNRPSEAPGQRSQPHYPWPYVEGLTM